jgi:hypothetical protein
VPGGKPAPFQTPRDRRCFAGLARALATGCGKNGILRHIREEVIAYEQSRGIRLLP